MPELPRQDTAPARPRLQASPRPVLQRDGQSSWGAGLLVLAPTPMEREQRELSALLVIVGLLINLVTHFKTEIDHGLERPQEVVALLLRPATIRGKAC